MKRIPGIFLGSAEEFFRVQRSLDWRSGLNESHYW